jgi:uncharacterized LabA/DUF88 family protein
MFKPKTKRISQLAQKYPEKIKQLEWVFDKSTNVYIDWANVFKWQERLNWHISTKRLKQLFDSFNTIREVKFYVGRLVGNKKSENFIEEVKRYHYIVKEKEVKVMRLSIDTSSISLDSPELLKQFIRESLLKKLSIETIEYLNAQLKDLNRQGITYIEDLKCNFDVEIGRDMLLDYHSAGVDNFVLWSGDSDFYDPLKQLLEDKKKVILFATARKVAKELNELRRKGLFIFDIQKIKEFICWSREMKCKEERCF